MSEQQPPNDQQPHDEPITPSPYPPQPQTGYPGYPPLPYMQPPPKKRRTWLWIVPGVTGLIVFGCIGFSLLVARSAGTTINSVSTTVASTVTTASTPTVEPTQTPIVAAVGDTLIWNDAIYVTLIKVSKVAPDEFTQPKSGNEFIVVHLKIENKGTGEVDYNPFDFHVKSGEGNITDYECCLPSTYTANNLLNSGKLSAGGSVTGDIGFQVVKGDHQAELTWQPNILGNAGENGWNLGL